MEFEIIAQVLRETKTENMELLMTVWNQLETFATQRFRKLSDQDFIDVIKEMIADPEFQGWAEQYRESETLWNLPDKDLRERFFKRVATRR